MNPQVATIEPAARIVFLESEVVALDHAISNITAKIASGGSVRNGPERLVRRKVAILAEILALKRTTNADA